MAGSSPNGGPMGHWRLFLHAHRGLVVLLVAMTLAIKALVPTGYMVAPTSMGLDVVICSDPSGQLVKQHIEIPLNRAGGQEDHGRQKADGACSFASLSLAALGGVDILLLGIALAFIIAVGFAPVRPPALGRRRYLIPPLRGPPVYA